MPLQDAVASLAADFDYTRPHPISIVADFFHAYPRLSSIPKNFSVDSPYTTSIYKLAIPYAITGFLFFLFALILNFCFYFKRGVVPGTDDTRESDPNERDRTGRAFLFFSCFLNLAIVLCIGIAFNSAFIMRHAANNAQDGLIAAQGSISLLMRQPALVLQNIAEDIKSLTPAQKTASNVITLFTRYSAAFNSIVDSTGELEKNINRLAVQLDYLSTKFFLFTISVLISCIGGLMCTFVCDATTPDARKARIISFALLLIPMVATWSHTAISTSIAAASGDFCQAASEYHTYMTSSSTQRPDITGTNVFLKHQLGCPSDAPYAPNLKSINIFFGNAADLGGFSLGFVQLRPETTVAEWEAGRAWMQDNLEQFSTCITQLQLAGQVSFHICGDHGVSAVSAIGQLWLCSCGLTLLFLVIVALLTWGHPPSEFVSGREMMYIYGAPQLISAFGDVREIVRRHTTFFKLKSRNLSAGDVSLISTVDSEMERAVARQYNLVDEDTNMSTDRDRRQAYSLKVIVDQHEQNAQWYLGGGNSSSHSSQNSNGFS